jgi:hypothetical protein
MVSSRATFIMPWPCSQVKRLQLHTFPTCNLLNNPHMTNWKKFYGKSSGTLVHDTVRPSNVNKPLPTSSKVMECWILASSFWRNLMPFHFDSDQTCLKSMLLKRCRSSMRNIIALWLSQPFKFYVGLFSLWESLFADMVPWIIDSSKNLTICLYSVGF